MTTHTPRVTPTQDLILELLAARHRLGEQIWTLTANAATKRALIALEGAGLVGWKSGIVERTYLAWLTNEGKAQYMSPTYSPPAPDTHADVTEQAAQYERLQDVARLIDSCMPERLDSYGYRHAMKAAVAMSDRGLLAVPAPDRAALVQAIGHNSDWCTRHPATQDADGTCCDAGDTATRVLALLAGGESR